MDEKSEYCWQCGTLLVQGASFCKRCGAKAEPPEVDLEEDIKFQYCARCGAKVSPRAAFCTNCGLELARPSSMPRSPMVGSYPVQPEPTTPTLSVPSEYAVLYKKPVDPDRALSLIEGVLIAICSFPFYAIPGLLGWAVWRGKYPRRARHALVVGILAFAVNVAVVLFILEFRPDLIPPELRRMLEQPF